MPIYAYRCDACGFEKDHLQKLNDATLSTCPECGQESYIKQLTAAGIQLKGSGWYATDFKGGGEKSSAKSENLPPCATGACPSACTGS
jgi:putative FmdB family regulatory protein